METDEETEKKITWRIETVLEAWLRYGVKKPLSRYEKRIRVNCKKYEHNVTHINQHFYEYILFLLTKILLLGL